MKPRTQKTVKYSLPVISVILLIVIAVVIVFFHFIRKENTASEETGSYEISDNTFTDTSHENSHVTITYPQIDAKGQKEINDLIKDFAEDLAADIYGADYTNLDLNGSCRIAYQSDQWLSVVFEGSGYVSTAAYPNGLLFAMNINLEDLSQVSFSDIYSVNDAVLKIINRNFDEQFVSGTLEKIGVTSEDESYEGLVKELSAVEIYGLEETLQDEKGFYLTETSVIIRAGLPHAIGDYFEVEIEYAELEDYLLMD